MGADVITPALQRVVDGLRAKLAAAGVPPHTVELDYRTVTFVFTDVTAETIVKAGELLPKSQEVAEKRYYFDTRTAGRGAAVGAETVPADVQRAIDLFTDRLIRNDAAPVAVTYAVDPQTKYRSATFSFYTTLRAERAAELLPSGYKTGAQMLYLKTRVLADTEVGQVAGVDQSTPWTCGPAALRAVLAHHGINVSEDEVAVRAGNVPVLGVRPDGLVKAAQELGCYVSAVVLRGVDALAPFLARDLPVLLVVDSWTNPGQAGHWVVATALEGDKVRLMDPHTPGNWRVLPKAELDRKWWHRERGQVVRRFALIVAPERRVELGADAPTHGRTANLVYKGMPAWLDVMGKVQRGVTKALVTAFSGGTAAKAWDAVQGQLMSAAGKMNAKEFATWLNNATNEEVAALRLGQLRKVAKEARGDKAQLFARLGLTEATLDGPLAGALTAVLREELFAYGTSPMVPPQQSLHFLQALTILLYGVETLPVLDARLKAKPKVKTERAEPGQSVLLAWADQTLAALDQADEESA